MALFRCLCPDGRANRCVGGGPGHAEPTGGFRRRLQRAGPGQAALTERMQKAAKARDDRQRGIDREKSLIMQQIEADKADRKDRSWR